MASYVLEMTEMATKAEGIKNRMCFACGRRASGGAGEHVFPKWLQNRLGLFDKTITLLNGTFIPYRNLTIPCCDECNNGFLSTIENSMKSVFERGSIDTSEDVLTVARWLAKILLGLLVKETSLRLDRASPEKGTIFPPEMLDELSHCHFVLLSARKNASFDCMHGEFPFSFYHYKIESNDQNDSFDFSTNLHGQSVAMRLGQLGVIFVNDGGLQMHVGAKGPFGINGASISSLQFSEVSSRVHYKAALRDATHFYITAETPEELQVKQVNVKSFSGYLPNSQELRIFRDWDEYELSFAMANYMRLDQAVLFDSDTGFCITTLVDESGKLRRDPSLDNP